MRIEEWLQQVGPGWGTLAAAVALLAGARLTRLLTTDEISRPVRDRVIKRLNADNKTHQMLAYLLECPWCVSVWLASAQAALILSAPDSILLWTAFSILAGSQIAGMLGSVNRSSGQS